MRDCGILELTFVAVLISRHGHALAVAGNVAFVFGGASSINQEVSIYFHVSDLNVEPVKTRLSARQCCFSPDIVMSADG